MRFFFGFFAALVLLSAPINANAAEAKPTVKIGVILPLTGNNAHAGEGARKGVMLRAEELKKEATKYNYELLFEDDEAQPAKTNLAARKLLDYDKVDALMLFGAAAAKLMPPLAERYPQTLFFNISAMPDLADGVHSFGYWASFDAMGKLAAEASVKLGHQSAAIISAKRTGPIEAAASLKQHLQASGVTIASEITFTPGERDFRTELQGVIEAKPSVVYVISWMPEQGIILQRLKELGCTAAISSVETFSFLPDKSVAEGSIYSSGVGYTKEFGAKFKQAYSELPTFAEPQHYDAIDIISAAYEANAKAKGKPNLAEIVAQIHTLNDRPTATGTVTTGKGGAILCPPHLLRIEQGQPVEIKFESLGTK